MKLIKVEKMETCASGDQAYKYFFDEDWKKEHIEKLAALGKLKYYGNFPRPLFEVKCAGGATIIGVEQARDVKVVFPRDTAEVEQEVFQREAFQKALHPQPVPPQ
ncbi:hypothetical protein AGMMS49928_21780 [Spirochaetia bacterium]|nr:hypothetical protein AGMMS49928_21780 [Spirochaetia bacterium]